MVEQVVWPVDLNTQGPCNKTAMVDQCKGVRPKQLPHAESCIAKYPDGEHVILHQGWWVSVIQRCGEWCEVNGCGWSGWIESKYLWDGMEFEVIEPPSVRPVLLAERREELLQIQFENKFSKKKSWRQRLLGNENSISAREWQGLCKLNKVSYRGTIPEMQERLRRLDAAAIVPMAGGLSEKMHGTS